MRSAVRAADAVIVVVSAVDGVEVQTEYAWELAVQEDLPRAIFVNKLDRERADFQATLDQLVSSFGNQVAPFELPIGAEQEFNGIADLLHEKADLYPSGPRAEESDWPDEIHAMADPAREKLIEAVAESDDALIEQYLEEGTLPEATIAQGAKDGFANARLAPVFVGSASKAIGIDRLLDFIVEEFPSPLERAPLPVIAKGGEERERSCDPNGPLTAFVFKTVSDPFVGHITMFRVFSGKMRPDTSVHNATQGTDERIGQLFALQGQGARERLRGAGGRHRGRREAPPHPHRRHVLHEGRPRAAPSGGAPRAAPRVRDLARRPRARRTGSPPGSRASARRTRRSGSPATTRPTRP